jgi:vacuolar-type H+-ATPase subunit E/Vma4
MNEQERKLRDEILSDAKRKAERTVARAEREAAEAHKQMVEEQQTEREQALERARQRADARSRAILVTVDQEARRQRLLAREEILGRSLDQALEAARSLSPEEAQRSLTELLSEAMTALGPGPAKIRVRPADADLFSPELLAKLGHDAGTVSVIGDERMTPGIIAESSDGLRRFDNTYATRCERLRERLRALLADGIDF